MTTDVVFLGAGASLSAGFPTNKNLTNYIIYEFSSRNKYGRRENTVISGQVSVPAQIENDWPELAESLRRTGYLSVDEYCEHFRDDTVKVEKMKKMLRMALFDHSYFWFDNNDYKTFLESLFLKRPSTELNRAFTIVNFNYDGLLGTLLTDAINERRSGKSDVPKPTTEQLAAIAGGYYSLVDTVKRTSGRKSVISGTQESGEPNPDGFCYFMPHGTMLEGVSGNKVVSFRDIIFGFGDRIERETRFLENYNVGTLIRFPWETDGRSLMQRKQLVCARHAIGTAKRIHFIGLSGHQLLGHSLLEIFEPLRL